MPDLPPPPSLTRRVFGAAAWTMSGHAISLGIRFGANLLLTRLLAPDAFGLVGIATVVMVGLTMFSDLGLRARIIQSSHGGEAPFLNTAWTVQIIRGFVLMGGALLIAGGLALAAKTGLLPQSSVYADPQLPTIIAALSSTAVIGSFLSTKYFEAGRRLALGWMTAIELFAQIVGVVVIFTWLWFDRSIWALVAGQIAGTLTSTILSHTALPGGSNRLCWDHVALQNLLHFGKWFFLSSVLTFFATSADKLILGALTGAYFLGLYTIAFNLVDLPAQIFGRLMANAAFPALSQVARERAWDLKRAYYKFHTLAAPTAYLLAGVLVVASPSIIGMLYDPRYRDAGWIMQILSLSLLAIPFQLSAACFVALGKPQLSTAMLFARVIGLVVAMPLGFHVLDLEGAIAAVVFSQLCALPVVIFLSHRLNLLDVKRELVAFAAFPLGLFVGFGLDAALLWLQAALLSVLK